MTLAQIIVTTTGIVINGAQSIELRTPFSHSLSLSGPVEQSPFMLAGAASLSMDRAPLQHRATYSGSTVTVQPSAFRKGRVVEVVVDGVVVGTVNGYNLADQNLDGFQDALDMDTWLAWWMNGDERADANADQYVDAIDYDLMVNTFLGR